MASTLLLIFKQQSKRKISHLDILKIIKLCCLHLFKSMLKHPYVLKLSKQGEDGRSEGEEGPKFKKKFKFKNKKTKKKQKKLLDNYLSVVSKATGVLGHTRNR